MEESKRTYLPAAGRDWLLPIYDPIVLYHFPFNFQHMTTYHLLKLFLTLHLAGLAIAAGTAFTNYIVFQRFWKGYAANKQHAISILRANARFPLITATGIGILILSGIGMMHLTQGIFMGQLWFRIKMGAMLLLLVSLLISGRSGRKLCKMLTAENGENYASNSTFTVQKTLKIFNIAQLLLFLIIFLLSAFRFN